MIPEGDHLGPGRRAVLATLALGMTVLIIYALFSSGFGRPPRLAMQTPAPAPAQTAAPAPGQPAEPQPGQPTGSAAGQTAGSAPSRSAGPEPGQAAGPAPEPIIRGAVVAAGKPSRAGTSGLALAVISDDLWLTYLPRGLERTGGGAIQPRPGIEGGSSARFGSADGSAFFEARVEHGTVAATWDDYRRSIDGSALRDTTVRGRPAVVGRYPAGGLLIAWLERPGTGVWIRVSDSLGDELVAIAASAQAPVGD